jgi:hypothetical protein
MVFPFYGKDESPTQKRITVMFPFYMRTIDYLTGATDTSLFPFWRRAKGADNVDVRRYWPAYSFSRTRSDVTEHVAWPLWRQQYVNTEHQFTRITWGGTFFYRNVERVRRDRKLPGTDVLRHEKKTLVWPLVRVQKVNNGFREVAVPLYWPFDSPSIREEGEPWRPFVSLYQKIDRPNGDKDVSALFATYMYRRTKQTKRVRLLWGLLGWDREPTGRYLRLLFAIKIRVSKKP